MTILWFAGDRQSVSSQGWFLDALKWADKLGVAAQIGVQVIMQQPHLYGLFEPTPVSTNIQDTRIHNPWSLTSWR